MRFILYWSCLERRPPPPPPTNPDVYKCTTVSASIPERIEFRIEFLGQLTESPERGSLHALCRLMLSRQTGEAEPMLLYCRASVANAGQAICQHWVNVSCLLTTIYASHFCYTYNYICSVNAQLFEGDFLLF